MRRFRDSQARVASLLHRCAFSTSQATTHTKPPMIIHGPRVVTEGLPITSDFAFRSTVPAPTALPFKALFSPTPLLSRHPVPHHLVGLCSRAAALSSPTALFKPPHAYIYTHGAGTTQGTLNPWPAPTPQKNIVPFCHPSCHLPPLPSSASALWAQQFASLRLSFPSRTRHEPPSQRAFIKPQTVLFVYPSMPLISSSTTIRCFTCATTGKLSKKHPSQNARNHPISSCPG
jgi:hypothetical protein